MRLWFYFRTSGDALLPLSLTTLLCVMLSPSSDHHITPQIYISYEICGARRCSIPFTPSGRVGTGGMYEPNQFVMNCGVVDPSAGPIRFSSPVARNLNDGDSIYLLVRNTNNTTAVTYNAVVRYAITLQ